MLKLATVQLRFLVPARMSSKVVAFQCIMTCFPPDFSDVQQVLMSAYCVLGDSALS